MCQLTPNRCWIDFSNTLAPFGSSRYVSFSNVKFGKSFRNKPRDYGTPSFFASALRLKKTAKHPTDEGTRAGPFRAGISRAPPMAESEGFSNFGIESKFLSPVPWPQWGEGFWVLMVGGCFLEGELQGEVFEAMEMIFSFLVGLIQIFCEVIFVHVYILLVTSKMQVWNNHC